MDDVSSFHGHHSFEQLRKDEHGLSLIELFLSGNVIRQIAFLTKFEENIKIGLSLLDVNQVDDIFMFAVIEQVNFPFEQLN